MGKKCVQPVGYTVYNMCNNLTYSQHLTNLITRLCKKVVLYTFTTHVFHSVFSKNYYCLLTGFSNVSTPLTITTICLYKENQLNQRRFI
jgi:hypothetical protein